MMMYAYCIQEKEKTANEADLQMKRKELKSQIVAAQKMPEFFLRQQISLEQMVNGEKAAQDPEFKKKLDIEDSLRKVGVNQANELLTTQKLGLNDERFTIVQRTKFEKIKCYEFNNEAEQLYTVKGVTTVKASIAEATNYFNMETGELFRTIMDEIFHPLFVSGAVLHSSNNLQSEFEALSVNWMALRSATSETKIADYLLLRYGNIFECCDETSPRDDKVIQAGAQIWQSIEISSLSEISELKSFERRRLTRSGLTFTPVGDSNNNLTEVNFFLSVPWNKNSQHSKSWKDSFRLVKRNLQRLVDCLNRFRNIMEDRNNTVQKSSLMPPGQWSYNSKRCNVCVKSFSTLRRKHHCRMCGQLICWKCSVMKDLALANKKSMKFKNSSKKVQVRICINCSIEQNTQQSNSITTLKKSLEPEDEFSIQSQLSQSNTFKSSSSTLDSSHRDSDSILRSSLDDEDFFQSRNDTIISLDNISNHDIVRHKIDNYRPSGTNQSLIQFDPEGAGNDDYDIYCDDDTVSRSNQSEFVSPATLKKSSNSILNQHIYESKIAEYKQRSKARRGGQAGVMLYPKEADIDQIIARTKSKSSDSSDDNDVYDEIDTAKMTPVCSNVDVDCEKVRSEFEKAMSSLEKRRSSVSTNGSFNSTGGTHFARIRANSGNNKNSGPSFDGIDQLQGLQPQHQHKYINCNPPVERKHKKINDVTKSSLSSSNGSERPSDLLELGDCLDGQVRNDMILLSAYTTTKDIKSPNITKQKNDDMILL